MAITAERLVATLEADIRRFEKGMADAVTIMDRRANQIEKRQQTLAQRIEKNFGGIGRSLSTIGVGKFLGTAALLSFGKSVLDTASALSEQAQQVGVNVEAFQAYEAILRDSGASNQQAQQAIARLSEQLGEAKDGSKTRARRSWPSGSASMT
jgi:prefoldin subunit 5